MSSNAERIFEQYMNGDWGKPNDKIRLRGQDILSEGTIIGHIHEYEDEYEYTKRIVIFTLQNFKRQRSWKTHRKQLVIAANKAGFPVMFVDQLDMGFGIMFEETEENMTKTLVEVSKFGKDKTACCAKIYYDDAGPDYSAKLYSYNQIIDDEKYEAEQILLDYLESVGIERLERFYTIVEPRYNTLYNILQLKPKQILYYVLHDIKNDTRNYLQLTNDIFNGMFKTENNVKIKYNYYKDKFIHKLYEEK